MLSLGPVGYYPLDRPPNQVQRDLVAGNDATIDSGATISQGQSIYGRPSLRFTGTKGLVIPADVPLPSSGAFSVVVWFAGRTAAGNFQLLNRNYFGSAEGTWLLNVSATPKLQFTMLDASNTQTIANLPVPRLLDPHMGAGAYDGTDIFAYLDGVSGTPVAASYTADDTHVIKVGTSSNADISDIAFFDRALTAAEVARLYAAGLV